MSWRRVQSGLAAAVAAALLASGCVAPARGPGPDGTVLRARPMDAGGGNRRAGARQESREAGVGAADLRTLDRLTRALRQGSDEARERAAVALGRTGDRRAVEALVAALKDPKWQVRCAAAEALGELGDRRAEAPLIDALRGDSEYLVRDKAALALGAFRSPSVADALVEALRRDAARDETIGLSLAKIADDRLVDRLLEIVKDRANSDIFRIGAARALGIMRSPRAVETLITLTKEDPDYRVAAVRALGKIGDPRAVEALATVLSEDANAAAFAAEALGQIGDRRAVAPLIRALEGGDAEVRASAVRALRAVTGKDFGDNAVRWREWLEKDGRAR